MFSQSQHITYRVYHLVYPSGLVVVMNIAWLAWRLGRWFGSMFQPWINNSYFPFTKPLQQPNYGNPSRYGVALSCAKSRMSLIKDTT